MSKIKKLSLDDIKKAVVESVSISEVCRTLGMIEGSNGTRLKKVIVANDIDMSHFTGQLWSKGKTCLDDFRIRKLNEDEILSKDSKVSAGTVRELLIKKNLIERKCHCGISDTWNDRPISLQLDHINGNRKDHSIENLRWICPNCHSQTSTFCSKNRRDNKKIVSDDDLIESLKRSENIRQGLAKFGLDNGGNYARAKRLVAKHNIEFTKIDYGIVPTTDEMISILNGTKKRNRSGDLLIRKCAVCSGDLGRDVKSFCSNKCRSIANQKVTRPSSEELNKLLWEKPTLAIAKDFGVSDKAVEKWSKAYGLTKPPRGYWAKQASLAAKQIEE